jgi:cytochrome P450
MTVLGRMDFGWSMALNNGEKWRRQRKAFNPYLTRSAVDEFKDLQIKESRVFLKGMLDNPDYNHQTRQLFGSMMIKCKMADYAAGGYGF